MVQGDCPASSFQGGARRPEAAWTFWRVELKCEGGQQKWVCIPSGWEKAGEERGRATRKYKKREGRIQRHR